jgi:transposase
MQQRVAELEEENVFLRGELERYKAMFKLSQRDKFGPKSERVEEIPADQLIFNEIEKEASLPEAPEETQTITYTKKKGRAPKKPFPEHLAREEKIIDLREEEKVCPHDGTRLKEIGDERTEKFKTIPAQMSILVEVKKKYVCPCCELYLAQPKSNSILPGTIATPELLSFIVFSKFFQGLPLYRLEELFRLQSVVLSRGTMARWLIGVTKQLMPIYNLLQDQAFESGYLAIDATHVQVLKEPGREAETKSTMWIRGSPELGIVLFEYDVSGAGKIAKKLTTGFKGALQADAHPAYNQLDQKNIKLLGCMMHSRRRFHKAFLAVDEKPGLAADGLAWFRWLYAKEDKYKEKGLSPAERKVVRDQEIRPAFKAMKEWAESKIPKVPKSSPLGNALHYFVNQYDELTSFLSNGRYEMDNGWCERTIKKFAIGRNAWLFCDTQEGAHASAMLYSLALTAKLNGKDPFKVMTEIFSKLPEAVTVDDFEKLTNLLLSPVNPLSCRKKEG